MKLKKADISFTFLLKISYSYPILSIVLSNIVFISSEYNSNRQGPYNLKSNGDIANDIIIKKDVIKNTFSKFSSSNA